VSASFATGFLIVFAVIGGLELADRTCFALIAYASRAHAFASWAGASLAFVASSALAVSVGAALLAALGPSRIGLVRVGGGVFLIGYAAWVYFHPDEEEAVDRRQDVRSALLAAFATIFLLELGDDTMIFEIVFVTTWGWLIVFVAGAAALVTVAAWNVQLGRALGRRVSPQLLHRIVVVVLVVVGALTILYGLAPNVFPSLNLAGAR
jgi:putative Ca2+/H+ antiporter (TMEM165/GDT1 family)